MSEVTKAAQRAQTAPDRLALTGFAVLVVIGGINFPAVKATVQELAPMWSAGVRFTAAAAILLLIVALGRQPFPRGRALAGSLLFGALSFGAFYAFAYWGIQRVPAGAASVVLASAPLATFVAAVLHRLESFRWLTLAGALLAIAGIGIMVGGPGGGSVSLVGLLALLAAAICAGEAGVVAKKNPPVPPMVMNAIAMGVGGLMLLALSFVRNEPHTVPRLAETWFWLAYLVVLGSIVLFVTYLFVLRRWTASGTSYVFVLFPVVAVAFAAVFQDERVTLDLVVGGLLVIAGVYVGALLHVGKREPRGEAVAETPVAATTSENARPEMAGVPADCVHCP
ncbi:MAG TPA: EamA family transporter [Actinomycetota bacterium]|nr:EamA family transporter [Actinomycetota bacterium]